MDITRRSFNDRGDSMLLNDHSNRNDRNNQMDTRVKVQQNVPSMEVVLG